MLGWVIRGGMLMPEVFDGSVGTNGWHADARPTLV